MKTDDSFFQLDLFADDEESERSLEEITRQLKPNPSGRLFEYTALADDDQRAFIDSPADTIRLLAPAGSGKTQSIVNKVLTRVSRGEPLAHFLVLTFDKAAQTSLRQKFDEGLKTHCGQGQPQVMTLNSFGYRQFRGVLNERLGRLKTQDGIKSDQREAAKRALKELREKKHDVSLLLPKELAYSVYLGFISMLKNHVITPESLGAGQGQEGRRRFFELCNRRKLLVPWLDPLSGRTTFDQDRKSVVNALLAIYARYDDILRNHDKADFDDQKLLPYLAFREDQRLAQAAMAGYKTVVVDEFQDINVLDFELIRLVSQGKQLIVVGDDDQAIYAFRGSSPDFIIDFEKHVGRPVMTHILSVNYRCPRNVVAMANSLIAHNEHRVKKSQTADREDDADIKVWHCLNSGSEAQIIARTIRRWHEERGEKGFRYADVAVLFRMNSQSLPLQMALILQEIPYCCRHEDNVIVSGLMEKLIGLLGLHLALGRDPGHSSPAETALLADCFFRGQDRANAGKFHEAVVSRGGYRQAAEEAGRCFNFFPPFTREAFREAVGTLYEQSDPASLVQKIGTNFKNMSGLIGSLQEAVEGHLPLGELVDIATRFQGDTGQFHSMLAGLLEKVRGGLYHADEGDAVNLLTYFRAKGRQWGTVFLPGVNQGVIPHAKANTEEERRLLYVAITRATSNLVLSYVRQAVRSKVEPSQFLAEMGLSEGEAKRAGFIS